MIFERDGEAWTVATQADATTDPAALRDNSEVEAEPTDPPTEHELLAALMIEVSLYHDVLNSVSPVAAVAMEVSA